MNRRILSVTIAVSTAWAMFLSGCDFIGDIIADKVQEKVTEKVAEEVIENALEKDGKSGDAEVDLSSGKVEVKTDKGKLSYGAGKNVEIPKNFPTDVTIPKNITVKMAIESEGNFNIMGESDAESGALSDQEIKDAESNGWKKKTDMNMGNARIMAFEKENRKLTITVANSTSKKADAPTTILNLNVQSEKK